MTFEQKLKAAALEAALHPALRHAAKTRRERHATSLNLPQASPAAYLTMHKKPSCMMQSIPCCRKRTGNTFSFCWNTPPDFANDKKDAARSAASFLLYIFLQSRLFAPLFNITPVCQLLTVLCKPF